MGIDAEMDAAGSIDTFINLGLQGNDVLYMAERINGLSIECSHYADGAGLAFEAWEKGLLGPDRTILESRRDLCEAVAKAVLMGVSFIKTQPGAMWEVMEQDVAKELKIDNPKVLRHLHLENQSILEPRLYPRADAIANAFELAVRGDGGARDSRQAEPDEPLGHPSPALDRGDRLHRRPLRRPGPRPRHRPRPLGTARVATSSRGQRLTTDTAAPREGPAQPRNEPGRELAHRPARVLAPGQHSFVIDELFHTDECVRALTPEQLTDPGWVRELDDSGYVDSLYPDGAPP